MSTHPFCWSFLGHSPSLSLIPMSYALWSILSIWWNSLWLRLAFFPFFPWSCECESPVLPRFCIVLHCQWGPEEEVVVVVVVVVTIVVDPHRSSCQLVDASITLEGIDPSLGAVNLLTDVYRRPCYSWLASYWWWWWCYSLGSTQLLDYYQYYTTFTSSLSLSLSHSLSSPPLSSPLATMIQPFLAWIVSDNDQALFACRFVSELHP